MMYFAKHLLAYFVLTTTLFCEESHFYRAFMNQNFFVDRCTYVITIFISGTFAKIVVHKYNMYEYRSAPLEADLNNISLEASRHLNIRCFICHRSIIFLRKQIMVLNMCKEMLFLLVHGAFWAFLFRQ